MQFTSLGHTGLTVSRICLGCMSYGSSKWRPWVLDEADALPFYKRALDAGINFFDTADMYSLGTSEEITGRALRSMAKMDEIVLATKVFWPMRDGPNMKGLSRKHITQACEASLERLGVDTIDLYQIHRFDAATPIDETLAALNHLVESGKVRYLGASSGYAWELMRALSVSERNGWARFVCMQPQYNLLYREEEREMTGLCLDQSIGMLPWSPLARGRLARPWQSATAKRLETDRFGNMMYSRTEEDDRRVVDRLVEIAQERGVPQAQVALAWLLFRPAVAAPIVGATKPHHLEDAVAAVELVLTADEVKALEEPYAPHPVLGFS